MSDGGPLERDPPSAVKLIIMKPLIVDLTYTLIGSEYKPHTERVELEYHDDIWPMLHRMNMRYITHSIVDDGGRDRKRQITVGEMIALLQQLDPGSPLDIEIGQHNKLHGWHLIPTVDEWHPMTLAKQWTVKRRVSSAGINVSLPNEAYVAKWPKDDIVNSAF